jgi:DNA-directed RNA polymerase subunit RPC12/RpoP
MDDYERAVCPSCGHKRMVPTFPPYVCVPCQDADVRDDLATFHRLDMERM